jgi:hypothetical protein
MSDLTPRVNNIEAAVWKIGDIKHSFLDETQFQSEHDDTWVLCDGSDITGSDLHAVTGWTSTPDVRGRFLRAKDHTAGNNPDGDLALGTYQADQFGQHSHDNTIRGGNGIDNDIENNGQVHGRSGFAGNKSGVVNIVAAGGNETRPKNVTCNMYIKINREPSA